RLDSPRNTLPRLNAIVEESTRQMTSPKRQASKAERYARLRDEMREKLKVVLASKFDQMGHEETSLRTSIEGIAEEIRGRAEAVSARETEHSERTQRGYAIENEIAENRQAVHPLGVETDRARGRRPANQGRCAELDARPAAAAVELERAQSHLLSLPSELETNRRFAESAAEEVAKAQHEWQMHQQKSQAALTSVSAARRQQEGRRHLCTEARTQGW